ncbi:MAG: hypothetical protein ACRC57_03350 [Sarcina sp.]
MNKNLKLIPLILIAIVSMNTICLASNIEERYETIWVENTQEQKDKKDEDTKNKKNECVLEEVLNANKDDYIGKEFTFNLKIKKVKKGSNNFNISASDINSKKAECMLEKFDENIYSSGDEIIIKGTIKEIKKNKVLIEKIKLVELKAENKKEFNKDKYRQRNIEINEAETKKENN